MQSANAVSIARQKPIGSVPVIIFSMVVYGIIASFGSLTFAGVCAVVTCGLLVVSPNLTITARIVSLFLVFGYGNAAWKEFTKTDQEIAAEASAKQQEEIRRMDDKLNYASDCFSAWDGSSRDLVNQLKQELRDPASFEHIKTLVGKQTNGLNLVTMQYRARNGFGGMNIGTVTAHINSSCRVLDFTSD